MEHIELQLSHGAIPSESAYVRHVIKTIGRDRCERLLLDWPHLRPALSRLARLTGCWALYAVWSARQLFAVCLEEAMEASEQARARGGDSLAAFVAAASGRMCDVLEYTVSVRRDGSWRRWEPIEEYLLDLLRQEGVDGLKIENCRHALLSSGKHREARAIIAARVFSLNDLLRAGIV